MLADVLPFAVLLVPFVPLFFFAGCPCCVEDEEDSVGSVSTLSASPDSTGSASIAIITDCSDCTEGMPRCWEIAVAGITDSLCSSCDAYNGTFLLEATGIDCQFDSVAFDGCGIGCGNATIRRWRIVFSTVWVLLALNTGMAYELSSGDPCNSDDLVFTRTASGSCCGNVPTTINAEPSPCS